MMAPTRPTVLIALKAANTALRGMLREHNIEVLVADSGVEVVAHLFPRVSSYRGPSLMVLSAILPGYNGLSVLAGIRSLGWQTPVMLTWPSNNEWMLHEAVRLGCSAQFEEPVSPQHLTIEILRILKDRPQIASRSPFRRSRDYRATAKR